LLQIRKTQRWRTWDLYNDINILIVELPYLGK